MPFETPRDPLWFETAHLDYSPPMLTSEASLGTVANAFLAAMEAHRLALVAATAMLGKALAQQTDKLEGLTLAVRDLVEEEKRRERRESAMTTAQMGRRIGSGG